MFLEVLNPIILVRNEDVMRSPTSPLADDLVENALIEAKSDRKLSVTASDITQVTPRGEIISFNYHSFTMTISRT